MQLKGERWKEELESIKAELTENPELYQSRGVLNSHGRTLALRFGEIAASKGLIRAGREVLGDGDYSSCVVRMARILRRAGQG